MSNLIPATTPLTHRVDAETADVRFGIVVDVVPCPVESELKQMQRDELGNVRLRFNGHNQGASSTRNKLLEVCVVLWEQQRFEAKYLLNPGCHGLPLTRLTVSQQESLASHVLFFDDDLVPHPGCVPAYVAAMQANPEVRASFVCIKPFMSIQLMCVSFSFLLRSLPLQALAFCQGRRLHSPSLKGCWHAPFSWQVSTCSCTFKKSLSVDSKAPSSLSLGVFAGTCPSNLDGWNTSLCRCGLFLGGPQEDGKCRRRDDVAHSVGGHGQLGLQKHRPRPLLSCFPQEGGRRGY